MLRPTCSGRPLRRVRPRISGSSTPFPGYTPSLFASLTAAVVATAATAAVTITIASKRSVSSERGKAPERHEEDPMCDYCGVGGTFTQATLHVFTLG